MCSPILALSYINAFISDSIIWASTSHLFPNNIFLDFYVVCVIYTIHFFTCSNDSGFDRSKHNNETYEFLK
jgi:hypothetical protein